MEKLKSRKFWMSVAAMLAAIGAAVAGSVSGDETVTAMGVLCTALSAGIYAASEAYVDGQAAWGVDGAALMADIDDGEGEEDDD